MGRISIFLALAACAALPLSGYERKGGVTFGSRFMNMELHRFDGSAGARDEYSEPVAAGTWNFRLHKDRDMFIKILGRNGSQPYLKLKLAGGLGEALVYSPDGRFEFFLPAPGRISGDERGEFPEGHNSFTLFPPSYDEISAYRNLALNPYDFQGEKGLGVTFYPHASASSECRGEMQFKARNAVDGFSENGGHSAWRQRSWGPEREGAQEFFTDFGREVEIDRVSILLRADFPHDSVWPGGVLEFSDGSKVPVKFKKTAERQDFKFPARRTTFVRLSGLEPPRGGEGWRALTEFEAWGRDVMPFEARGKNGEVRPFADILAEIDIGDANPTRNLWLWRMLGEFWPAEADWLKRDLGEKLSEIPSGEPEREELFRRLARKAAEGISDAAESEKMRRAADSARGVRGAAKAYVSACSARRREFLARLEGLPRRFLYVERYPIAPSFYGYTEAVSDARGEMKFAPDSALCMLEVRGDGSVSREVLLEDKTGTIRDPDVSYDGKRALFSWKKSVHGDDFHIYEMDLATRKIRQITDGKCADIDPRYLPTGEIVFNSTRCEQTTDCWNTDVSNLYIMRPDGSFMRRVGFDQVCTTAPSVNEQGDVVYTRWDYNDRGQTFTQGLFSMKPDGSFQTELYGNKSWYPTAIGHARQIPGTGKYLATLHGHHTAQRGKLAEIDPSKGRQEDSGVELLAPRRREKPVRQDAYGQGGPQFQYPFPLSEDLFLVTFHPFNSDNRSYPLPYGLYLMDPDGRRELLAYHPYLDSKQAVAAAPRKLPKLAPSALDYRKKTGTLFIRNIYYGDGVKGVPKGAIKKVRVVKIEYRRAPVGALDGKNNEGGVGVANMVCTPVALGQGAWDTKEILGEVDVAPDGSVYFEIPARTPVYFQPIDADGNAVTTMRSWTAMQPGEFYSCLGCHGDRDTPHKQPLNIAPGRRPAKLRPFYDVRGGFSFRKHIQPILDRRCVSCHNDRSVPRITGRDGAKISVGDIAPTRGEEWLSLERKNSGLAVRAFSLLDYPVENRRAKRLFNDAYYNLLQPSLNGDTVCYADFTNPLINWPGMQSVPTLLPPYYRGAAKSEIMGMLKSGHGGQKLTREELDKIAAWIDLYVPFCGDYREANLWSEGDRAFYDYFDSKGRDFEAREAKAVAEFLEGAGRR